MSWELHNLLGKILDENKGSMRNLKYSMWSFVMIGLQWRIMKCILKKLINHTWKQLVKKIQCFQKHLQFSTIDKSICFVNFKSPFRAKINEPEKNNVRLTLWVNSQVAKELCIYLDWWLQVKLHIFILDFRWGKVITFQILLWFYFQFLSLNCYILL